MSKAPWQALLSGIWERKLVYTMTKEVLLTLRGLQFDGTDPDGEHIETILPGEYYKKGQSHYVIYDEVSEGFEEPTKNIMKFREHALELTKKGLINVHMVFEEKKKNMSSYGTPYGGIMIGIDTGRVSVTEKEDQILVEVEYRLEVNYEHLADCRIKVDIRSRNGNRLTLQESFS